MALLLVAGLGGGLTGSIAGLASLATYPALLAVGLAPVTANVTNTVALVFNSVGSVSASRPELVGQSRRIRRMALVALVGGLVGGVLLLTTPGSVFEKVVPWLIGAGSLAILVGPRPHVPGTAAHRPDSPAVLLGAFLITVYGGYFGAAAGVLMLAMLLVTSAEPLARSNALKNLTLGVANLVAAVLFVIFGSVDWAAAAPLAVGLFAGGRLGPVVVRHTPARALRIAIAVAGLALAGYLAAGAYG